jgi:prepilin-type processing-associated H-X9-DG protein
MTATRNAQPPLPMAPSDAVMVAPGVGVVVDAAGDGTVWLHGAVAWCWDADDEAARRLAAVQLVETGTARQRDVAAAFAVTEQTVHNWRRRAAAKGVTGLVDARSGPKGPWKVTDEVRDEIVRRRAAGGSLRAVAQACEVSVFTVRQVVAGTGGHDRDGDTRDRDRDADDNTDGGGDGGGLEVLARPVPRTVERAAARAGVLAGAPPQICQGASLPVAGALLALPGLAATGLLEVFEQVYGSSRAAFYDLRAVVLTVVFACLLGEPRAEGLTRIDPTDLGRLLGLDRAPVVETLRRRVGELAGLGRSDQVFEGLARTHLREHPGQAGMFYLDGHVRAYHGPHDLPKAHVARMRISMPATVDSWLCDRRGDGVLVWTSQPDASLVGELKLATDKIRELVGADARPTIVFDRGGWSPRTFAQLVDAGFDILTYRKQPVGRREPATAFADHTWIDEHGHAHTYRLADRTVRIYYGPKKARRYFQCRQITRDCGNGHHTTFITTRTDDNPALLAHAMFSRWRQENYFRYMRARFDLDGLDSYATVADDPDRTVPNPDKAAAATETRRIRSTIATGQAALDRHRDNPTLADSVAELATALDDARRQLADHQASARDIPARIPLAQRRPDAKLHHGEHKRLIDAIRMACYNTESGLARAVRPYYARAHHEARTLLREALSAPADLHVADGRLHVTLNPLSAPRRTRAVAQLCRLLTDTETLYPGTDLILTYHVKSPAGLT